MNLHAAITCFLLDLKYFELELAFPSRIIHMEGASASPYRGPAPNHLFLLDLGAIQAIRAIRAVAAEKGANSRTLPHHAEATKQNKTNEDPNAELERSEPWFWKANTSRG